MTREQVTPELTDHLSIRDLSARYNRAADDADGAAFAATFTPDGRLDVGGKTVCTGSQQLAAFVAKPRGTVHVTADAVVELNGDEATQACTLILFRRSRDGQHVVLENTGRYEDELVRTPDGWRFAVRRITFHAAPPAP